MKQKKSTVPMKDFSGEVFLDGTEIFEGSQSATERQNLAKNYLEKNTEQVANLLAKELVENGLTKVIIPAGSRQIRIKFVRNGKYRKL
jgi:hypothetical protein